MRISDWSSDVCSSDLERLYLDVHADVFGRDAIEAHDGGVADGVENAVMDHGQELAIRSDRGKRYHAALAIACAPAMIGGAPNQRSKEHTSGLQSLMRNSYAAMCLRKNKKAKDRN